MDLRHLRYFVAVAEDLHFGRAAARIATAQPALSQTIRQLERLLGVELFDRNHRRVALTPAGQLLLSEARLVIGRIERARARVDRLHQGQSERLSVGFGFPLPVGLLAPSLRVFLDAHDGVDVELRVLRGPREALAVETGEVDVAVVFDPDGMDVDYVHLHDDELVAVLPPGHAAATGDAVSSRDLADDLVVVLDPADLAGTYGAEAVVTRLAGYDARVIAAPDPGAVVALVTAGRAIGLLPRCAVPSEPVVVALPMRPRRGISIALAYARPVAPMARAFLDIAAARQADLPALNSAG